MITGAIVYTVKDGGKHFYMCDDVIFDPKCGFLKLMRGGQTSILFSALSWSHVEISRTEDQ